ncbi:unnamed protein product [Pedinophyceae sp. YPF-701]|nr:unnamed protein product [Pedinophyceae sp. YPF-701]
MRAGARALAAGVAVLVLLRTAALGAAFDHSRQGSDLGKFFRTVDTDGDGLIGDEEAFAYVRDKVGGSAYDEPSELEGAVKAMVSRLDGEDAGGTVDVSEMKLHLNGLHKSYRVAEWVRHGLGLPQYAKAFLDNAVTARDFPILVNDGGRTLKEDLGVESQLHRSMLIRAFKMQILGLGRAPAGPSDLRCQAVGCRAVKLSWTPPQDPGDPPMHKYVVERKVAGAPVALGGGFSGKWKHQGDVDDEDAEFIDTDIVHPGALYVYRVLAWGAAGRGLRAAEVSCTLQFMGGACTVSEKSGMDTDTSVLHDTATAYSRGVGQDTPGGPLDTASALDLNSRAATGRRWVPGWLLWGLGSMSSALVVAAGVVARSATFLSIVSRIARSRRAAADADTEACTEPLMNNIAGTASPGRGRKRSSGATSGSDLSIEVVSCDEDGELELSSPPADAPSGEAREMLALRRFHKSVSRRGERGALSAPRSNGRRSPQGRWPRAAAAALEYARREKEDSLVRMTEGLAEERAAGEEQGRGSRPESQTGGSRDNSVHGARGTGEAAAASAHRGPGACAEPSCAVRFDRLKDLGKKLGRHQCGMCQMMFCAKHTAVTSHGALSKCAMDSRCLCQRCFASLPAERREAIMRSAVAAGGSVRASFPGDSASGRAAVAAGTGAASRIGRVSSRALRTDNKSAKRERSRSAAETTAHHAGVQRWRSAVTKIQAVQAFGEAGARAQRPPKHGSLRTK